MLNEARKALRLIRECVDDDRFVLAVHFTRRMEQRGLFWPDVLALIDNPHNVRSEGLDRYDRPKWALLGAAASGVEIEIICAIEVDETETEFITIYWEV